MKSFTLIFVLWLCSQPIFLKAQYLEFDWVKSFPIIIMDLKIDNEDNLYIFGSLFDTLLVFNQTGVDTITPQIADLVLIKLNPLGEPIWARKFFRNGGIPYGKLETK